MPYGTPGTSSLDAPAKRLQEKSTSQNSASETSTFRIDSQIQQTPDAISQNSSFIPLGVFSNQELFEVDAMRLRNPMNSGRKRKNHPINQENWRVPYEDEVPWLAKDSNRQYKSVTQRYF